MSWMTPSQRRSPRHLATTSLLCWLHTNSSTMMMASHHHHQASGISGIAPLPPSLGSITPPSLGSIAHNQQLWASHRQQHPPCAVILHIAWSPSPPPSDLEALIPIVGAKSLSSLLIRLCTCASHTQTPHSCTLTPGIYEALYVFSTYHTSLVTW